jgi:beta-lactamase superfamily II metal-dependent hydrolase
MTSATLTILDVGHGSCVVLNSATETALIDTGAGATVLEHLRSLSRTTVRRVLISHADQDHAGALTTLLADNTFNIDEVWLNADAFKGTAQWTALNYELDAQEHAFKTRVNIGIKENDEFATGPFDVKILAPRTRLAGLGAGNRDQEGRRLETNSLSIVARIWLDKEPLALLPGDLDEVGLSHLLDQEPTPDLRAPILVFPHHGGHVRRASNVTANANFASQFTKQVMPSTVVFSIGRGHHGTPRQEIVDAVRSAVPGVNILCTQLSRVCSAALVAPGNTGHLVDITSRGRYARACCAGTVVVDHDGTSLRIRPSREPHQAFITANAPTAICRERLTERSPNLH